MGLKEFLVSAKAGLSDLQSRLKIHIVIGNEACDLDSTISAITYAYYLHQVKHKPGTFYLPILNIPRQQFRLRLETVYFLNKHNIQADDLSFISDLDLEALTQNEVITLTVTLVDHHILTDSEECLRKFVVGVLDHRPQHGELPQSWNAEIELVGSCCSLVARKMLASETFHFDATVAELLLGTILTDTGNMSTSDNIGTPADHEVLVKLKAFLPPSISATSIYEEIRNSKFDLSSLTVLEMLHKDLKILRGMHITVAMSSITMNLEHVLSSPEFSLDANQFLSSLPADVLIIMTLWKEDEGSSLRRIAVFSSNRVYREQITDVLLRSMAPNLDLHPMTLFPEIEHVSAFIQNNVKISRKGVLPLIRDFLAGEEATPDENVNAFTDPFEGRSDGHLESSSSGEKGDTSEEEARRHINLAKSFQSDQFRTSQDRYDLAAVGTDALISPSLSTDSELSSAGRKKGEEEDFDAEALGDIREEKGAEEVLDEFGSPHFGGDGAKLSGAGDGAAVVIDSDDAVKDASLEKVVDGFVDNLIDFGIEDGANQVANDAGGAAFAQKDETNDLMDFFSGGPVNANTNPFMMDSTDVAEHPGSGEGNNVDLLAGLDMQSFDAQEGDRSGVTASDIGGVLDESAAAGTDSAKGENTVGEDILQNHSPFDLLCPNNVDSPMELSSMPTSGQASGQGSKVPSYPDTPPNSYMEPAGMAYKETQLPSFNSSEMVRRIQEKKAALAGHSGKRTAPENIDDDDSLYLGGAGSSGGGGSLISPAVPQNSYVDVTSGFDFMSSGHQLPKLTNTDIMERVNEKRSQFEWSVESLDGSTSGVDVGPNSEEGAQKSMFNADGTQQIPVSGVLDPQVPYTPQNSFVDGNFDSFARANLPSMNSAEMVAKIKAKQSAMFGSGSSSRVSRSSHGSDDSGGCHSPEVQVKSSRGTSLDSPQVPYTPQNSYRDNLGVLDARSQLADLNEVAERLSIENSSKRQFGSKQSGGSSGGAGSREEENLNPGGVQQHVGSQIRHSSDSQNTMSDVESLMSVSTDVGTPSENIVASGIANQMRNEIAMLSRKDTGDSDVFQPGRQEENAIVVGNERRVRENNGDMNVGGAPNDNGTEQSPEDEAADDVPTQEFTGAKELFSPVDSGQLQTLEDHAIFEAAESIVAQSVAAALHVSQTEEVESGRGAGRLRWNDNVESNCINYDDNDSDNEFSRNDGNDNGFEEDEEEAARILAEGLPDGDEDMDSEDDQNSPMQPPGDENVADSEDADSPEEENVAQSDENVTGSSYHNRNEISDNDTSLLTELESVPVAPPGTDIETPGAGGDPGIADLALNELAFELANELIQSALEDFPFHQETSGAAKNGTDIEVEGTGHEGSADAVAPLEGVSDKMDNEQFGRLSEASTEIPSAEGGESFDVEETTLAKTVGDQLSSSPGSSAVKDRKHSGSLPDSRKYSASSLDSNSSSSSSERKRSRDTDSSMTIMEDEIMTSFPERKPSSEFIAVEEEEEIISSFPGRKFSKSDDFPARRFSRDDNSSRRSSRMEDSDLDVSIEPGDVETDYLPNMDPLQGNLDIIDASFSKITDTDREVVEGESFRKVSGQEFTGARSGEEDEEEEEEEDRESIEEGYRRRLAEDGYEERQIDERKEEGEKIDGEKGERSEQTKEDGETEHLADVEDSIFDVKKTDEETLHEIEAKKPKQKKKIRVSFSEDFDDEIGDFNIVSSSRSPLKSPPPPIPPSQESVSSSPPPLWDQPHPAVAEEEAGAVYSEEWQDDGIEEMAAQSGLEAVPSDTLRKKIVPDSSFAQAMAADEEDDMEEEDDDKDEEVEDSDTGDLEWENDTPVKIPSQPGIEPTLAGESTAQGSQRWKRVSISGTDFDIDLQAVEPYKNVLSHGGYYEEGLSAIIVFYGCHLPSRRQEDYAYVMNHLFHYVIHTLEELVADDYVIIYFHGSTPRRQMPGLGWLKRCYQSIDRRLKKNLKGLFLVHPTLWLRTIVTMIKPFISSKFSSKLRFVRSLEELNACVPMDNVTIPEVIVHYDIYRQHLPTPPASPQRPSTSR